VFVITVKWLRILCLIILFVCVNESTSAQCIALADSSGVVQNTTLTDSADYFVTFSSTCSFYNGPGSTTCGMTFPSGLAPWSGNTNGSTSLITYTFSVPITSVGLLVGYVGVHGGAGSIAPESFTFTTNNTIPYLNVNSGTCSQWITVGNQTTSPSILGPIIGVHTISATLPFTSFTIATNSSGTGPGANGGSAFALCDASIVSGASFNLGNDTNLCVGENLLLDVFKPNATYLWQDNSTNPTFNVTQPGEYWVEVTVNNITTVDTVNVSYSFPSTINLGNDTTLCEGEELTLSAKIVNGTYLWQDNSTSSSFNVTEQGTYWAQANNNCGTGSDTIEVTYKDCSPVLEVPNVFTPNGDGNNDLFIPVLANWITSYQLIIYNRWGQEIFYSERLMHGWDGRTSAGIEVPNGTYYWIIKYKGRENSEETLKGHVSLLR